MVVRRQNNTQAGALCLSGNFRHDRPYFAAIKSKIAERMIIESAKRLAKSACLTALSIVYVGSACGCADSPHHLGNDLGESERAIDPPR